MQFQREFEGAFNHHGLALAFVAERAHFFDGLAGSAGYLFGADLCTTYGTADAGVEMDDFAAGVFERLTQEPAFLFLGVLGNE